VDTDSRRLELLKLEGLGFSQAEVVKELSVKCECSERTVYSDFETRESWQPSLQSVVNSEGVLFKVVNRYEQIYRQACMLWKRMKVVLSLLKALVLTPNEKTTEFGSILAIARSEARKREQSNENPPIRALRFFPELGVYVAVYEAVDNPAQNLKQTR